jgi:hypothetical protein
MKTFKTKTATRKAIYNIVGPLTRGIFDDNSWENVNRVWKALEAEGVAICIESAKYDGMKSKTWQFAAEVNGFTLTGTLVACFCGTVEDPTGRYDLCFII